MGNSRVTTNKKDREKSKQQKRLEKQKRKEIRRSSGTTAFEDMIAYADEYGVLHSTPQDTLKEEIDTSDIAISIPKQEEKEEGGALNGIVDFFNEAKGFGFIKPKGSNERYFFHISNVTGNIKQEDKVTFELEQGVRGMNAVRISIINQ